MNDHTHNHQPPTLREVLDGGEDLVKHVSMDSFVADLAEVEVMAPKALRDRLLSRLHESDDERTSLVWAVEVLDHRDLMARVVAVLPPDAIDELRRRVYEHKHEHPLEVSFPLDADDEPTDWNCCNCGAKHEAGEAEALIVTPGHGCFDYPLFYCRPCIAMAAASLSELDAHV